jgi:hypothetical protein
MCWPALEDLSWYFDYLDILSSWEYSLPLISLPWLLIQSEIEWSNTFACKFTSSGTWEIIWLWDSCYSWWLSSPRQLGVAEELWQELVIVLGHLPVICEGFLGLFPDGAPKATLVDCSCHWATSLAVGSSGALGELGFGLPISRRTTKCWSTQQEHSMLASTWTSGEKSIISCLFGILLANWLTIHWLVHLLVVTV